jgi:hypothetical protein
LGDVAGDALILLEKFVFIYLTCDLYYLIFLTESFDC